MKSGDTIGKNWRVDSILAKGLSCVTFLGTNLDARPDLEIGAKVVVKALPVSETVDWKSVELFQREVSLLRGLDREGIPRYFDSFEWRDAEGYYIALVQEYIEGNDLRKAIESGKRFTEDEIVGIMAKLCGILGFLHSLRPPVIHRDVNPKNIIMRKDGSIALVDFSGAQDAIRLASSLGTTMVGTAGYAPIEQFAGNATVRSDLYGAAATCLYLLTRVSPSELPVRSMKIDFRSVVQASAELACVLDNWLEPDEAKRSLPVGEALSILRKERPLPPSFAGGKSVAILPQAPFFQGLKEGELAGEGEMRAMPIWETALPSGSSIRIEESGNSLGIIIPPGKRRGASAGIGGFSAAWLGFVAFWTFMAVTMGAPIFFPLFSVPFWIVGFFLLRASLKGLFGRVELVFDPDGGFAYSERLFFLKKERRYPLSELGPCTVRDNPIKASGTESKRLEMEAGVEKLHFLENRSRRELDAVAGKINAYLAARLS